MIQYGEVISTGGRDMVTELRDLMEVACLVYIVLMVHELGHFATAYILGMPVSSVELGTGPRLFQFLWKGIWFRFYLLPLFGFVKTCWLSKSRRKNLALFLAGPIANLLFALALYAITGQVIGMDLMERLLRASLAVGFVNLMPLHFWGMDSDGLQILRQFKAIPASNGR